MRCVGLWLILTWAGCGTCGDNVTTRDPLPVVLRCVDYEALMASVDDPPMIPSIVPAPVGVRIIVSAAFRPFAGASYPVPGGRMAWVVWVFRWYDGDHLGAIGQAEDDLCRWYDPI
jgi:hypothetical protein